MDVVTGLRHCALCSSKQWEDELERGEDWMDSKVVGENEVWDGGKGEVCKE